MFEQERPVVLLFQFLKCLLLKLYNRPNVFEGIEYSFLMLAKINT